MTKISPNDVAAQLPSILSRASQGEEFVVTDHGQPVARIVPPEAVFSQPGAGPPDHAAWQGRFDDWMRTVDARAGRYPTGFHLDDTRESIYNGRGA